MVNGENMSRKDGSYVKKMRLDAIAERVAKEFPNPVSYSRVVLWAVMEIGLTHGRAEEYVSDVIAAHGWFLDGDQIKNKME